MDARSVGACTEPFRKSESLVLGIPSRWSLGLGHGSVSEAITSWAMLIYLSEDGGRLEAIDRFFRLVCPNYLASSRNVLSGPWPKADVLLERIEWGRAFLELCQHQTWWIEDAWDETPNCKLPLLQIVSTKALELLRLFEGKLWTRLKAKDLWLPGFDACAGANKSWSYCKGTKLQMGYDWCQWRWQMILAGLGGLLGGLRVWNDRLEPEETNPCRTLSSLKVFLGVFSGSRNTFFRVSKLI